MKRFGLLLFAWCLLASLLAARSEAAPVCPQAKYLPLSLAQDAGAKGATGGIGGTGHGAGDSGGIGGTGIVGTITGFASICVNGLEVHYAPDVPVSENGRPVDARQLAVGQLVTVEAVDSPRGLEAQRVGIVQVLEGPVTRPAKGGWLEVMGAAVLTSELVASEALPRLRRGDWVQVSGHADRRGRVLASRIVRIAARAEATVVGLARPASRRVGAVQTDQRQEGEVIARGRWDGYRLRVRDVQPAPDKDWRSPPGRIVIETRVLDVYSGRVRTGRPEVDALLGAQSRNLKPGDLVRISARRNAEGQLQAERVDRAERGGRAGAKDRETAARPEKAGKDRQVEPPERHKRDGRGEREDRGVRAVRLERPDRSVRAEPRERPDRNRRDH